MKTNSTKGKKNRKKVVVTRRVRMQKSISSRSLSLGNLSNNKHRITAVLKNNKTLALALQDARCELSAKQKLLENAAKNFKSIMQVRSQMLEMHSMLKSFMKNFDDTLMLLTATDIQISDLTVPFQSCSEFKSKMKTLAESVEKVSEEDSSLVEQAKNSHDEGMMKFSKPNISNSHNSSNVIPMEVTNECVDKGKTDFQVQKDLPVQVFIQNASPVNLNSDDIVISFPSVLSCENSEEVESQTEETQASPSKIVCVKDRESSKTPKLDSVNDRENSETPKLNSVKDRESSGTPKLSICNIQPIIKSKKPSNFENRVTFINPLSPVKNSPKKINTVGPSSQTVRSSKIPKFLDPSSRTKIKTAIGDQKSFSQKPLNICAESGKKFGCRKTFVVKNTDAEAVISETSDNLKQKETSNENNLNVIDNSRQIIRRETFVIKNSDIPENKSNAHCDRRKTFVQKKSKDNIKTRKSVKGRRGTFVVSDAKENDTNCKNVTEVTENLVFNDTEKASYPLHCERIFAKELSPISDKDNEIAENSKAFDENLVCSKTSNSSEVVPHQNHSEEFSFHDNETVTKTKKSKFKEDELNLEKGNSNNGKKSSFKAGNVKEKVVDCDSIKLSDICVASQDSEQDVIKDVLTTETVNSDEFMCHTKTRKRMSYKAFYDSSDSECEIISDLNIQSIEEPTIKSIPIRRKISGSRKKKVFAFSVHKRKSVQSKKSLCKPPKILKSKDVPLSDSTEKEDVNTSASKYHDNENLKEIVDFNSKMCNKQTSNSANYCNEQEILQSTGDKVMDEAKTVNEENLKNQDNQLTELSLYKSNENLTKDSLTCHNSPVITSDKFLNAIECERENLDFNTKDSKEEHGSISNEANESKSNVESNKVVKHRKVKRHVSKCDIPVDDIGVKRNAKRNSKKQSKQKFNISQEEENECNFLVNKKGRAKKTKAKGISKKQSKISLPGDSTIVVEAEVHPPPRFLSKPETDVMNKENCRQPNCDKFQVSVVLNDILESTDIDMLSLTCKNKLVSNCTNIPLKIPLSDNSSNIPTYAEDNIKSKRRTVINDQEVQSSKRNRKLNYAEPSLRKKMRR